MALALAEKYSALSLRDCLRPQEKVERCALIGDPLVDLPLLGRAGERSFAVPPGIEVGSNKSAVPTVLFDYFERGRGEERNGGGRGGMIED